MAPAALGRPADAGLPGGGVTVLTLDGTLRADDPPAAGGAGAGGDTKGSDAQIYATLRDVINQGADLYNPPRNDQNGCYRLFQGALLALKPQLAHRPELQKAIEAGLRDAEGKRSPSERAFTLRKVIDDVRGKVNPNPAAKDAGAPKDAPPKDRPPVKDVPAKDTPAKDLPKDAVKDKPAKDAPEKDAAAPKDTDPKDAVKDKPAPPKDAPPKDLPKDLKDKKDL